MPDDILEIKRWGDDLGVRLPAAVVKAAHLHADQRVRLSVEEGCIVITPLPNVLLTLEQRLARFDLARHGGEAMAAALSR